MDYYVPSRFWVKNILFAALIYDELTVFGYLNQLAGNVKHFDTIEADVVLIAPR